MRIRDLKAAARKQLERVDHPAPAISKKMLWHWMLLTDHGKHEMKDYGDSGRMIFYANPFADNHWSDRLTSLRPSPQSPRVLITGTNAEVADMMSGKRNSTITKTIEKHGLKGVRLEFASRIASFWEHFYGAEDFFSRKARDIPALIIATGAMRNYSNLGGETMEVKGRLEQIAETYGIQVAYIEPWWS